MTSYVKSIDGVLQDFSIDQLRRTLNISIRDDCGDDRAAEFGLIPIVYDSLDAPLGYAAPVAETRNGKQVAVAYALGTPEERQAEALNRHWMQGALVQTGLDVEAARAVLDIPLPVEFTQDDLQQRIDALTLLQSVTL